MTAVTPKKFRSIERRRKAGTFGRKPYFKALRQELAEGRKTASEVGSGLRTFVDSMMARYTAPNSTKPRRTPKGGNR